MKLYINKDIAADADKMRYWLTGQDAVSYNDISAYLEYMREYAPEDNHIDVEIHSCGGDCTEGYAIYDALRASGKEISCKVVGQCASMASVILLAAPKENRTMYQHAEMLIHEPYFPSLTGSMTIAKLEAVKADLEKEKEKMLAVYEERTGTSREVLEAQLADGGWFGTDKAIELGFISSVVPSISAHEDAPTISTTTDKQSMKINETSALGKAFATIAKALGVVAEEEKEEKAVGLTITDVNGTEIEIEREEGEPQVGDKTSAPDGEYTLEDGRILVIEDGVITEIKNPEEEETEEEEAEEEDETKALKERVAELEAQLAEAKTNGKTEDDNNILALVEKAGGMDWLKKQTGSYTPSGRANDTKGNSTTAADLKANADAIRTQHAAFKPYWKAK